MYCGRPHANGREPHREPMRAQGVRVAARSARGPTAGLPVQDDLLPVKSKPGRPVWAPRGRVRLPPPPPLGGWAGRHNAAMWGCKARGAEGEARRVRRRSAAGRPPRRWAPPGRGAGARQRARRLARRLQTTGPTRARSRRQRLPAAVRLQGPLGARRRSATRGRRCSGHVLIAPSFARDGVQPLTSASVTRASP